MSALTTVMIRAGRYPVDLSEFADSMRTARELRGAAWFNLETSRVYGADSCPVAQIFAQYPTGEFERRRNAA